ncbi:MAG: hypothetical protein J7M18_02690, partial [Candidatus Eremiobacteraeota bacterium]|nr:hypothetical protein [Candidatus Eremiobacteraeota bacterium]
SMARTVFDMAAKEYQDKEYGKDYVNLGYKPGGGITIKSIGENFKATFKTDVDGKPVDQLPIMRDVVNYDSFNLLVSLSAGVPGLREYILIANNMYCIPVAGGCTAVSAPEMYPYLNSNQMLGLMGGLKGAAEYETAIKYTGDATKGMDAQSIAHFLIISFVIISNIAYFLTEKKKK